MNTETIGELHNDYDIEKKNVPKLYIYSSSPYNSQKAKLYQRVYLCT